MEITILHDYVTSHEKEWLEQGKIEGKIEGKLDGKEEEKLKIAKNMQKENYPVKEIAKITRLQNNRKTKIEENKTSILINPFYNNIKPNLFNPSLCVSSHKILNEHLSDIINQYFHIHFHQLIYWLTFQIFFL